MNLSPGKPIVLVPTTVMENPDPRAPSNRVILREDSELAGVREFLSGRVPDRGSPVVDLVNRMVF